MKKICLFIATCFSFVLSVNAQYWRLSGNNDAGNAKLGTTNSAHLKLYTNNFERLRITNSGNVGIGTYNSLFGKLHVYNNANSGTGIYTNAKSYGIQAYATGSSGYGVYGSGNYSGVYGYGGDYGVYGYGNDYGVYGYSSNSSSGWGLYGECDNIGAYGKGLYGLWGNGSGTFGYGSVAYGDYIGAYGNGGSYGVYGISDDGYGVYGYSSNSSGVYGYSQNEYAGYFDGDVYTTGSYLPSDRILKNDINQLSSAMAIIKQLRPTTYDYKQDGSYKLMNLPKGKHYGLISDELEKVLPNLVKATKVDTRKLAANLVKPGSKTTQATQAQSGEVIDYKAVNYTELIPILVAATQEQQSTIEQLNAKIEALTQLVNQLQKSNPELSVKLSGMSLGTAIPNPATGNTKITYTIPNNLSQAEMIISNAAGQNIRQMQLDKSGMINISTSNLASGTYTYSLVVSGKIVATNKFVVQR